jgi:hypothetical protein
MAVTTTNYEAERNIYGRHGKLFARDITHNGQLRWLSNVTEISATMTIDRLEVRRSGDRFVKYKAGEITAEGTLTMDKVNSVFERQFIEYANRSTDQSLKLTEFELHLSLEDSGIDGIEFNRENGMAEKGHEAIILLGVNFWSLPLGFSLSDMVTRDLDFTFTGIDVGGPDDTPTYIADNHYLPPAIY